MLLFWTRTPCISLVMLTIRWRSITASASWEIIIKWKHSHSITENVCGVDNSDLFSLRSVLGLQVSVCLLVFALARATWYWYWSNSTHSHKLIKCKQETQEQGLNCCLLFEWKCNFLFLFHFCAFIWVGFLAHFQVDSKSTMFSKEIACLCWIETSRLKRLENLLYPNK